MTALEDAAKVLRDACKDLVDAQNAYRAACEDEKEALLAQEQAAARKAMAGRFLRLIAEHGPPEDWVRDYTKDEFPPTEGILSAAWTNNAVNKFGGDA